MPNTLVLKSLAKSYGATRALRDVSIEFEPGEIHTILGENGSGKSTLVKILSGTAGRDAGEIVLDGRALSCASPQASIGDGIATVYQELTILPSLSVAENVWLGNFPRTRTGVVDKRELNRRCASFFDELGLDLDPAESAARLSLAQLQLVEFARACAREPRVLILDEATSALDKPEAELLISNSRSLAKQGTTVLFVSHRLDEVIGVSDRISTLVDGHIVSTARADSISREELLNELLGHNVAGVGEIVKSTEKLADRVVSTRPQQADSEPPLFECVIPASAGYRHDVRLQARKGEIVGLAGLQGHGQKQALRIIGGDVSPSGVTRTVNGRAVSARTPREAIAAGIYYIPEERKVEGILAGHPVADNVVLSSLGRVSRWGLVRRSAESRLAKATCERLGVRLTTVRQPIESLSGGNQQKVVLGRGLLSDPKVLLLDDSMRGIDVRAKNEIYRLLLDYIGSGATVILNSTEIPELIQLCSRVIVFHDHAVSAELVGDEVVESAVLHAMFGQQEVAV